MEEIEETEEREEREELVDEVDRFEPWRERGTVMGVEVVELWRECILIGEGVECLGAISQ